MKTAVINQDNIVVNVLAGQIPDEQANTFAAHFANQHGSVVFIRIEDERPVWIGGSYTDGEFTPPPAPPVEPEPQLEPEI